MHPTVPDQPPEHARVLIVDDEEANGRLLERVLQRAGFVHVRRTTDPLSVCALYGDFKPDLLLLDLHMPALDGFGVMGQLKAVVPADAYLPILVVTADLTPEAKRGALAAGAMDFLQKPFDHTEVLLRIRNLLETRYLHLRLQAHSNALEETVQERTCEVEAAHVEVLERLTVAAEYRDDMTGGHARRIGEFAAHLTEALGLSGEFVELIRRAAPLHDIGKIGVPDAILKKRGPLTPAELDVMQRHTIIGAKILAGGAFPLLQLAETIALTHHEAWDGSGYPQGLRGEAIPLAGRIVAVVDAFDALTNDRPYRPGQTIEAALSALRQGAGTRWQPHLVEVLTSTSLRVAELLTVAP